MNHWGVAQPTPRRIDIVHRPAFSFSPTPSRMALELVCWLMGFVPPSGPQWGRVRARRHRSCLPAVRLCECRRGAIVLLAAPELGWIVGAESWLLDYSTDLY